MQDWARKGESRTSSGLLNDLIQPRRHLHGHVVFPVADLPFPEVGLIPERQHRAAILVHVHALQALQAAELHDLLHHPTSLLLFLLGERAPHERRQLLQVTRRVSQHVLVPQEQHLVRPPLALPPELHGVAPVGASGVPSLAEELEDVLEFGQACRRWLADPGAAAAGGRQSRALLEVEVPEGDQHVLGIPAHVDDPAPGALRRDGVGKQGVGDVRLYQQWPPWWRRTEEGLVAVAVVVVVVLGDHHHLQEGDAVVGVVVPERVVGVGRRVRGTVERREGEGLEPGGAGFRQAGQQDVWWVGLDACASGGDGVLHDVGEPEASVLPIVVVPPRRGGGAQQLYVFFFFGRISKRLVRTYIESCMRIVLQINQLMKERRIRRQ